MDLRRVGLAVGALATAGAIAFGVSNASAATTTVTPAASGGYATAGSAGSPGASTDTAVTGDEATKASAAVTAKDAAVTVTSVRKDADGSYDVLGTKAGAPVMFDVSADLATVTQSTGGGRGAGGGASNDTPVTGDEATKASAAVTAKDAAVTVTSVRKDPDGSYDILGTKAGAPVMFDVSADLATVTQSTGGGRGGAAGATAPSSGATGSTSSSSSSGATGTTGTTSTV